MERSINHGAFNLDKLRGRAELARLYAKNGMDKYSGYGVGSTVLIEIDPEPTWSSHVYAGFNVNIPGMEIKIHAEQMAMFQALMDVAMNTEAPLDKSDVDLREVVVSTTEDDLSVVCGHCLQTARSFCEVLGCDPSEVAYIAASLEEQGKFKYDKHVLGDLLGGTYVENRGV